MKNKDIEVEAIVEQLPDECKPVVDTNLPVVKEKVRSNVEEKIKRQKVTMHLLSEGLTKNEVIEELKRMYSIADRQAYRYIEDCYDILRQSFSDEVAVNKSQSISWLYQLRNKAYADEDYSVALKAQENIDKITGVSTISKLEISGKDGKELPINIVINGIKPDEQK